MRFLSLCSGIEAASVASAHLGWECVGVSEIAPFPCAVLAHRYPSVPNFGDMTKYAEWPERVFIDADAIVGGPPCQAFSIAGARAGLDDARGNLTITYANFIDHADRIRRAHGKPPVWCLYENVPGLLSDRTNAFGCLLGILAGEDVPLLPPGGKWANAGAVFGPARAIAWRILDAQHFGVAQRRRRVFVVASAGNVNPAEVLFESEGVRRNSASRREAREETPGSPGEVSSVGGCFRWQNNDAGIVPDDVAATIKAKGTTTDERSVGAIVCAAHGQANAETRTDGGAPTLTCNHEAPIVAHGIGVDCYNGAVTGEVAATFGMNSGETNTDGPKILDRMDLVNTLQLQGINQSTHADAEEARPVKILRALQEAIGEKAFLKWCAGIFAALFQAEILRIFVHGIGVRQPTIDEFGLVNYALSRPENRGERALRALREAGCDGRTPQGWESLEQFAGELGAYLSELSYPTPSAKGFLLDLWQAAEGFGVLRQTLSTLQEVRKSAHGEGESTLESAVRRLTPVEVEFLQGFPRNYTAIPWKNKPAEECPDGPRYKALGNSWAVPCVRWIFSRIHNA